MVSRPVGVYLASRVSLGKGTLVSLLLLANALVFESTRSRLLARSWRTVPAWEKLDTPYHPNAQLSQATLLTFTLVTTILPWLLTISHLFKENVWQRRHVISGCIAFTLGLLYTVASTLLITQLLSIAIQRPRQDFLSFCTGSQNEQVNQSFAQQHEQKWIMECPAVPELKDLVSAMRSSPSCLAAVVSSLYFFTGVSVGRHALPSTSTTIASAILAIGVICGTLGMASYLRWGDLILSYMLSYLTSVAANVQFWMFYYEESSDNNLESFLKSTEV